MRTPAAFRRLRLSSLRLQLLAWIVLPLALVAAVNLWTSRTAAERMADLVTNRTLIASAQAIAEATHTTAGAIDAVIPPIALEMFATGNQDSVYYRVETGGGRLLAGYPDLPAPPVLKGFEPVPFGGSYRERPLMLIALRHPIVGSGDASTITVIVGVTLNGHSAMVRELWVRSALQQVLLVAGAAALALVGLSYGLRPLMSLRDTVRGRSRTDLAPLDPGTVQSELQPLVTAINQYMARVQAQMSAQHRFVQNAAHQLRTPIATLTTQAAFAARSTDEGQRGEALGALQTTARQLVRLAAQLLTLSRAEPGARRPRADRIDLAAASREVVESLALKSLDQQIDLGLEASGPVFVVGDGTMLREMIVNLVDNAITYTPPGGSVTVTARLSDGKAVLCVADSGPGIPRDERERVFERFYRVPGIGPEGSGLGLAIVREVVDAAGGTVTLSETMGGGLTVSVSLPAPDAVSPPDPPEAGDATSPVGSR